MQPRLVAISYPSPTSDGNASEIRSTTSGRLYHRLQKRVSGRLHRLSCSVQDLKSQLHLHQQRPFPLTHSSTLGLRDSWFDTVLVDPECRSVRFDVQSYTSRWQTLSKEIRYRILFQLERFCLHPPTSGSYQEWMNNLVAFQLTCVSWSDAAQQRLYESIKLRSNRYHASAGLVSSSFQRALLLRQSLRKNLKLASCVKHLTLLPERFPRLVDQSSFADIVASIVTRCPNLEKLTTFHVLYTHRADEIFHALSTRTNLKQHTWVVGDDEFVTSRAQTRYRSGMLSNQQTRLFINYHSYWQSLEKLDMISYNGRGVLEHDLFVQVLNMLPSLKNLHISSFDANDFSDETLLSLPPLTSLSLQQCLGVSETGLCTWAQTPSAKRLRRLVLERQNMTSLLTTTGLLDCLHNLETFRLIQLEFEPTLPLEFNVTQPLFASCSLKSLEWYTSTDQKIDSKYSTDYAAVSNLCISSPHWPRPKSSQHILSSILEFGFPKLEKVVLPGYDNLAGLLRWLRHSSWANNPQYSRTSPSSYASATSETRPFSIRPSSPNFLQYEEWNPRSIDYANLPALCERSDTILASAPTRSIGPASSATQSSSISSPCQTNSLNSNTDAATISDDDDDDDTSSSSATLASTSSLALASTEKFSEISVHGIGRAEIAVCVGSGGGSHVEVKDVDVKRHGVTRTSSHSSISLLLDGYVTAAEDWRSE